MPGVELAIDYGTSNTVALLRWPDGRTRPMLFDGSPLLPSAIWVASDRRFSTGCDAQRSARLDPSCYEPNPKRRVDELEVLLGEHAYPVHQLIAATLRRVVVEAQRTTGATLDRVRITHPVAWGPARRAVLEQAAREAGLGTVEFIAEPIAAAMYLTAVHGRHLDVGRSVLVYDLGAGTFDVTVLRRTPDGFDTLAYRGLDDVGGLDLDSALVGLIGQGLRPEEVAAWQRLHQDSSADARRGRLLLWEDVRGAKEVLSRQAGAAVHIAGLNRDVMITRAELDREVAPLLQRTVDISAATLRESRLRPGELAVVFLVGGGSRMPLVATMLHRALGVAPVTMEEPQLVVAEGALTYAPQPDSAPPVAVPTSPATASWPTAVPTPDSTTTAGLPGPPVAAGWWSRVPQPVRVTAGLGVAALVTVLLFLLTFNEATYRSIQGTVGGEPSGIGWIFAPRMFLLGLLTVLVAVVVAVLARRLGRLLSLLTAILVGLLASTNATAHLGAHLANTIGLLLVGATFAAVAAFAPGPRGVPTSQVLKAFLACAFTALVTCALSYTFNDFSTQFHYVKVDQSVWRVAGLYAPMLIGLVIAIPAIITLQRGSMSPTE